MHVGWRGTWDVGCRSYVVVAQGRRGPQASCRINGTQGKTAASGDSCSRFFDGREESSGKKKQQSSCRSCARAAVRRCRGCGCAACLVQETGANDLKRASRGGRRAVERNDVNPTHRHGNVQGTDGGVLAAISGANGDRLSKRFRLVG
jgi:hypothetical protein